MPGSKYLSLHVFSLILLPLSLAFLSSAILSNTPWFRLVVRKNDMPHKFAIRHLSSPLAFAVGGLSTGTLIPFSRNLVGQQIQETAHDDAVISAHDDGVISADQYTKEKRWITENNTNDPILLLSFWTLQTVTIVIPGLHNITKTLEIDQLADDPIVSAALKLSGAYGAVVDSQAANHLVRSLSLISLPLVALSVVVAFFFSVVECCRSSHRGDGQRSWPAAGEFPEAYTVPLHSVVVQSKRRQPLRGPLIVNGALTLICAVCMAVALGTWITRSLEDSKVIISSITSMLGNTAVDWLTSHTTFQLDLGLVEYVSALGLLTAVSLMNLCTTNNSSSKQQFHYYISTSQAPGYLPPHEVL